MQYRLAATFLHRTIRIIVDCQLRTYSVLWKQADNTVPIRWT